MKAIFVDKITPYLKDVKKRQRLLGVVFNTIGASMRSIVQIRFAQAKDPDDKPWTPLKNPRPGKKKKGIPLNKSGLLKRSFYMRATSTYAIVGTNLHYAKYHDSDKLPRTKIPKRKFTGITTKMNKQYEGYIKNFIARGRI